MNVLESYLLLNSMNGLMSGTSSVNYPNALGQGAAGRTLGTQSTLSFLDILRSVQGKSSETVQNTAQNTGASRISTGTASMDRIFEQAAKRYHVDANLLKAIGKAESGFDPSVVSSAGAIGVMQLMPGTARSLGVRNPYDAQQNIMGGAKYISQLLKKYDGNVQLALAGYNAGPGNVAKYGGIPPFQETKNYVNRVLKYMGQQVSPGSQTVVTGTNGTDQNSSLLQNAASADSTQNDGSTITIDKDTLLALVQLMRTQMEMQWSSMMSSALSDTDSSNNVFSL